MKLPLGSPWNTTEPGQLILIRWQRKKIKSNTKMSTQVCNFLTLVDTYNYQTNWWTIGKLVMPSLFFFINGHFNQITGYWPISVQSFLIGSLLNRTSIRSHSKYQFEIDIERNLSPRCPSFHYCSFSYSPPNHIHHKSTHANVKRSLFKLQVSSSAFSIVELLPLWETKLETKSEHSTILHFSEHLHFLIAKS